LLKTQTESHSFVRHRVVTRGTDQGVGRVHSTGHDGVDGRDRAPGGETRNAISTAPDRSAGAGVAAVGLADLSHPRQMVRRVIDGQLLVGRHDRVDAPHALRDPEQIHQVLRPANQRRARGMRDRLGKWVGKSVLDQIETGVVRQIAIVEDKTGEPLSGHG
jgi:hypothetical protein